MDMKQAKRLSRILQKLPPSVNDWMMGRLRAPLPPKAGRRDHSIGEQTADGVRIVWIDRHLTPRGTLVFFHGGGYVNGPVAQQWTWLAELCARCSMAGVLIDYRKGGTAPYPAAPDDGQAAILELVSNGPIDPTRWAIVGDSAGAGLGLVVCRRLLDGGHPSPNCLVLASPYVDMRLGHPEIPELERLDPMLSRSYLARIADVYAPGQDLANPELSPLLAELDGFPPTHLCWGTHEIFMYDVKEFAEALGHSGVEVTAIEQPGGIHAYVLIDAAAEAQAAIDSEVDFLEEHLEVPS